jgi:predicted short-subunit dehydrogenase-like oxidoreductase (DUF2520 family)
MCKRPALLYPAGMGSKPRIAIVGPGRLGTGLALALDDAGYRVGEMVVRAPGGRAARLLARRLRAKVLQLSAAELQSEVVWFCVPDGAIAAAAAALASSSWKGKIALHPSGALSSDELAVLQKRGAAVASAHPMMTFAAGTRPALGGVSFALEGNPRAVAAARRIIRDLGGDCFDISKKAKPLYHVWGGLLSPLLVAHLACAEEVARAAKIPARIARRNMLPILRQTIENYAALGPERALTGPLTRGDVGTIARHLRNLGVAATSAEEVYRALSLFAVRKLDVKKRRELLQLLRRRGSRKDAIVK